MSERSERIANFRNKFSGATRFSGGSVGGISSSGVNTRSYNVGSGDGAISMTIGNDGRIVSMSQKPGIAKKEKNKQSDSKQSDSQIKGVRGKAIIGLEYDTKTHALVAVFGNLTLKNGEICIDKSGTATVFTATPHSGEI